MVLYFASSALYPTDLMLAFPQALTQEDTARLMSQIFLVSGVNSSDSDGILAERQLG